MQHRANWTIPAVIDFECLLAADANADEGGLRARDRDIFLRQIEPKLGRDAARPQVFRAWLAARRSEAPEFLPGEQIVAGWQTLVMLALLFGFGMGGSVTAALLHYKGVEPVNVSWFLVYTVGVQMIVLSAAIFLWVLRKTTDFLEDFHPLQSLLAGLVWAFSAGLRRLPGEERERVRRTLSVMGRKREIYGSLAVWPFLIVTQLFAVAFNLGILAVLLAHVAFTDLDFGWQSTFISSPEAAYRTVSVLSLPWSWAPSAHPTLDEVIGSHFEYSGGLHLLSKPALKSWWPFLGYAVALYGLALRGGLLILAIAKLRGALRGLAFDHEGCNALYRRLTGPIVVAQPGPANLKIPEEIEGSPRRAPGPGDCIALVASDADAGEEELAACARASFGWNVVRTLPVKIDHPSGNAAALESLAQAANGLAGVLVVVRAKRSPIKAIALFLQKVAVSLGPKPETVLLLIGQKAENGRARVSDEEFKHWRNFHALYSLRVSLERWSPP